MHKFFAKTGNGTKVTVEYNYCGSVVDATVKLQSNGEILDSAKIATYVTDDPDFDFIEGMIRDYLAEQEY